MATVTAQEATARLIAFVSSRFMLDQSVELDEQTPLLSTVLDSVALIEVVTFLEDEFDIELDDTDITRDNFKDIDAIANLTMQRSRQ